MSKKAAKQQQISTPSESPVSNLVRPLIRDGNNKHALELLFEGRAEDCPELKSVGFASLGPGHAWISYVITTKGKEVISIDVSEPNVRAIAEETAKTEFVTTLIDQGL